MSQFISLDEAVAMTTRYRENRDNILNPEFAGTEYLPYAESFDRSQFETFFARPECIGVRMYYGMDEGSKVHLVIVGIDDRGSDILPRGQSKDNAVEGEENFIIQTGQRCPPTCDEDGSPLNP